MIASRPRRVAVLVAAAVIAQGAVGGASAQVNNPNAFGPTYRFCGNFKAGYTISVYAHGITCATARRIQREYWLGPRSRKIIVNGGSGAFGYTKLKRYPGWRCGSGAGGGQCTRGSRAAAYQN